MRTYVARHEVRVTDERKRHYRKARNCWQPLPFSDEHLVSVEIYDETGWPQGTLMLSDDNQNAVFANDLRDDFRTLGRES
jgi:hypothetical protein